MSEGAVTVRRLAFSDLPHVISIERRAFTSPWSLAMFVLELSKPSSICLAAVEGDGTLVGHLVCARYDTVWHLMNVAVDPRHRRRGAGWALVSAMIEQAGPREAFTLEVRESNGPAIALYERLHFRAAGTRPRYYRDNGEDALIMWRTADTVAGVDTTGERDWYPA